MKHSVTANDGKFQHTLEQGAEHATVAAHGAIDSASDATRPALDHMVSNAHDAVDRLGVVAANAAEVLGVKGDELNEDGRRVVERTGGYVREHPVASLGMAVAAGFLLSRLFAPR